MNGQQNDEFRLSGPSQKSPAARDVGSSALSATPQLERGIQASFVPGVIGRLSTEHLKKPCHG